jgi:DNA-binding PadR family transcriptional regulator
LRQSLTAGNLWLSVLSLSARGKIYAYNLPDVIEKRFGFKPSLLLVYLVLYRLEGEGLLSSAEDGRRRYYSITSSGKAALKAGKALLKERASEL